ncbi:hypothetical protein PybrP1_005998 [[Pythium] brassicae (nom. inval.)]|nr:hypothetical protein PybrP1_005998 [[Pythium] brassicae (nom. inval.)]
MAGERRTRAATRAARGSAQPPPPLPPAAHASSESDSENAGPKVTTATRTRNRANSNADAELPLSSVLSGAFLAPAGTNASALARRLQQTWRALQTLAPRPQQEDADADADLPLGGLRLVCAELLHERVLGASEPIVRSLAACCVAELLRVHAPASPFASPAELYDAFQLLFEQLRGLARADPDAAATASAAHQQYVLESLAGSRAGALLVGVDFRVAADEPALLVQLFEVLFETIRREHAARIEALMLAVLSGCLEDTDMVEQPLLDAILAPLLRPPPPPPEGLSSGNGSSERGPYRLAQELLRRVGEQLQGPLSHLFNSILAGVASHVAPSALQEHVYALIYEVHRAKPSLLLYVLPNVCLQLQVDEVATRAEAVALLGRLFAASHADYGHESMATFRDFLGRFRDVSKEIRLQMVQVGAIVWQRKPELGALLERELVLRLSDPDWDVRRLVVNEVCDLVANRPERVSDECLRQVGERVKDKKVVLRKETMTGLSQVYAAHLSSCWSLGGDDDDNGDDDNGDDGDSDALSRHRVPSALAKKLGWVPDMVLKCFAYPQQELKLRVVQLLDDILLPRAASDAARAKGLLYLFRSLDPTSKEALRRILSERAKCLELCRDFVAAKKRHRQLSRGRVGVGPDALPSSDVADAAETLFAGLSPLFPEVPTLRKLLEQLSAWKDQSVFKHLEHLCDYSASVRDIRSAREQLVKCVGSKSPLGEFMKTLCRKLNLLTLNHACVRAYLRFFVQHNARPAKENRDIAELLVLASKLMPAIFAPFIKDEFDAVLLDADAADAENEGDDESDEDEDEIDNKKDQRVIEGMLGVLANYSEYWKKQQLELPDAASLPAADCSAPSKALLKQLEKFCWDPSFGDGSSHASPAQSAAEVHVAKLAALSIANFSGASKDTSALIQKLCAKKRLSSPSSPGAAATLQSLLVFTKRCGSELAAKPSLVATLWATLREQFLDSAGESAETQPKGRKRALTQAKLADIRCLAIRVLVNVVLHCRATSESGEWEARSQQVVELLFDLLRSDGRTWTSNASVAVKYRVVASGSLLRLMRDASVERLLSVSQWHLLGFVLQDSSEEVRASFLRRLTSHLTKHATPHPHKYVSYLVLAASESSAALKKRARSLLGVAVQRMRRVFEASLARGASADTSALMVPEYALPYAIHLLAHHPDFPREAAQRSTVTSSSTNSHASLFHDPAWSSQMLHLSFFLDGLVPASASADADNVAFLLQMLAKLAECDDVADPSSANAYPLVATAALVVKKKIRNPASLRPFPGRIYLPKQLFVAQSARDSGGPARGGPRIMTSLSPIKGSDIRDHFMQLKSPPASAKKRRPSLSSSSAGAPGGGASRKVARKSVASASASSSGGADVVLGDGDSEPETVTPPPRRRSLVRQARLNALAFTEEEAGDDDDDDDPDDLLPRTSVAARSSKAASERASA